MSESYRAWTRASRYRNNKTLWVEVPSAPEIRTTYIPAGAAPRPSLPEAEPGDQGNHEGPRNDEAHDRHPAHG